MGVAMSWLQQMQRRIAMQFATFRGEADVHAYEAAARGDPGVVRNKSDLKLGKSWLVWRFLLRRA